MSLTKFRTLGRSGLVVSPLALGTMTFGPGDWNADDATSREMFDAYSLVARDVESEHFPAAREAGMAVVPWSPLAGGFLSGKYNRSDTSDTGRLSGANPFGNSKFVDRNWDILDGLKAVAAELDRPVAQVALAWTLARSGVGSTLVGARKLSQLESNLAAADIDLSTSQMKRLDDSSVPPPSFSSSLAAPSIRRMIFGGHNVSGWGE